MNNYPQDVLKAVIAAIYREMQNASTEVDFAFAALQAIRDAGYVVVPKEPTPEMIEKGKQKIFGGSAFDGEDRHEIYVDVYRSIINARK